MMKGTVYCCLQRRIKLSSGNTGVVNIVINECSIVEFALEVGHLRVKSSHLHETLAIPFEDLVVDEGIEEKCYQYNRKKHEKKQPHEECETVDMGELLHGAVIVLLNEHVIAEDKTVSSIFLTALKEFVEVFW